MNNIKAIILSAISVATMNVITTNAEIVDGMKYFVAGVDEDGNTLFHKIAQGCHEPDRFGVAAYPMRWINQNAPQEKAIALSTLTVMLSDHENSKKHAEDGMFKLISTINTNPKARALSEIFAKMQDRDELHKTRKHMLFDARNNQGQTVLDIFKDQMQNHPQAEWCKIFGLTLMFLDAMEKEARKEQEESEKATTSVEKIMPE